MKVKLTRSRKRLGLSVFAALLLVYSFPFIIAHLENRNPTYAQVKNFKTADLNYLLLVEREPEMLEFRPNSDEEYRSSVIFGFRRLGSTWSRIDAPLAVRSESTSLFKPSLNDVETVNYYLAQNGTYVYGQQSVPPGLYWGSWRNDQFARHPIALALSDEGELDNRISLSTTQTLVEFSQYTVTSSGLEIQPQDSKVLTSREKLYCYIHESENSGWNHRDSMGCMNLFARSRRKGQPSDWDKFLGWFQEYDAVRDGPVLVIVANGSCATWNLVEERELPLDIVETFRSTLNRGTSP